MMDILVTTAYKGAIKTVKAAIGRQESVIMDVKVDGRATTALQVIQNIAKS
jgi:hypothetical protein